MDAQTLDYYLKHANEYANQTRQLDVRYLLYRFKDLLPPQAKVIDLGCAGGRDLKAFASFGLQAQGVEMCPALAQLAHEYSNCPVVVSDIAVMTEIPSNTYDGIWICATLVHSKPEDWQNVLKEVMRIARPGAVVFISVKQGTGNFQDKDGRQFFLYTKEEVFTMLQPYCWQLIVSDTHTKENTVWLNIWGKIGTNYPTTKVATTYQAGYLWGKMILEYFGIENATNESRWLLEYAIHNPVANHEKNLYTEEKTEKSIDKNTKVHRNIILNSRDILSPESEECFFHCIQKRAEHYPLDYLLQKRDFFNLSFVVSPAVLIPRPETELIVEYVCKEFGDFPDKNLEEITGLDIGTGSGCIAISLLKAIPYISMTATDISEEALKICELNAKRHSVSNRLHLLVSDLWSSIPQGKKFDYIVSNPPYLAEEDFPSLMPEVRDYEPKTALFGGKDGLDFYRGILAQVSNYLKPGGIVVLEVGHQQAEKVLALFPKELTLQRVLLDYQDIRRVIVAKLL